MRRRVTAARELEGLHVWVVEDDAELQALLLDELAWRGATVRGLGSAEALYRALLSDRCDIVVLDVGLPGEDGYAVASHLRASQSIGIVMLTGRSDARDMALGLTQGADLYLVKPRTWMCWSPACTAFAVACRCCPPVRQLLPQRRRHAGASPMTTGPCMHRPPRRWRLR